MTNDRLALGLGILIALLLWIPQKLTKEYKHNLALKISVDTPGDRIISSENLIYFPIEISGSGNKLSQLSSNIKSDTIRMPLKSKDLIKSYSAAEIISFIKTTYSVPDEISIRPSVNELIFEFDSLSSKTVPLIFNYTLNFKNGYGQIGNTTFTPSEITIKGPFEALTTINSIHSDALILEDIDSDVSEEVDLITLDEWTNIELSQKRASISLNVDQLAEKEVMVELSDFESEGQSWQLFPDKVLVRVSVPLKMFPTFNANDIDINLAPLGNQAVSVEIKEMHPDVHYVSHSPIILRYFVQHNDSLAGSFE